MRTALQVIFTNCTDADREEEFNRWYTHTHIVDLSATPGFVRARRFVNADPSSGEAKYMTVYELQTDDMERTLRHLVRLALKAFDSGRHIDCIEGVAAGNPSTGCQWYEIEPESLRPLEELNYPPASPELRRQLVQMAAE